LAVLVAPPNHRMQPTSFAALADGGCESSGAQTI
jgi:hypothetical protein